MTFNIEESPEGDSAGKGGYEPLKPEDIAELILFTLTRPPHVVLADVVVLPTAQASATLVKKDV
ncbi:MAG: hypothetical protein HRU69_07375 [Flammeovirgaceae bacterium]|nr:MAG: hypothetical protein HRU69_07375 [Flammeovirgaceae bacterium]